MVQLFAHQQIVEVPLACKQFYRQVQDAIDEGDTEPFFDFCMMPADWEVPPEQPKGTADPAPILKSA